MVRKTTKKPATKRTNTTKKPTTKRTSTDKKPSTRRTTTLAKSKKVPKKSLFKRARNYIIFSIILMVIGGSAERYKNEIYEFATSGYKEVLAKVSSATKTYSTTAKKY